MPDSKRAPSNNPVLSSASLKSAGDSLQLPRKKTELGDIPTDWKVSVLDEIADCLDNLRVPLNETQRRNMPGLIPYCGANGILDYVSDYVVDNDIILMAEDGGHFAEHKYRPIAYRMVGKCWVNNHAHILKAKKGTDQGYLFSSLVHKNILPYLASGTRDKLNKGEMKKIPIAHPGEEHEQQAIATALSDADALLESLDRLIAKKRAIKQGAVQQLLTGETRLPGFQGQWEVKCLGYHASFLKTGTNSRSELTPDGTVVYLHYGDIHGHSTPHVDAIAEILPRIARNKVKRLTWLEEGDVVFVDASEDLDGVGKSVEIGSVPTGGLVAGLHTIAARFDKSVLADGFKGYLQFIPAVAGRLRQLAAGTKVLATNRRHIAEIDVALPSVEEQKAIARTLLDMEGEIEALERRRDKARQIKQGMMQELLTGRTRLVEPNAEAAEEVPA